jgi:hypothetical protein
MKLCCIRSIAGAILLPATIKANKPDAACEASLVKNKRAEIKRAPTVIESSTMYLLIFGRRVCSALKDEY